MESAVRPSCLLKGGFLGILNEQARRLAAGGTGRAQNSGPQPSVALAKEPSRKKARIALGKAPRCRRSATIYEHTDRDRG